MKELPLFTRANAYGTRLAIASGSASGSASDGESCTYEGLLEQSRRIAFGLLDQSTDLREKRVSLLSMPSALYVAAQWAIWRAGGVCVPLSVSATESEWAYALTDSQSETLLTTSELASRVRMLCQRLGIRLVIADSVPSEAGSTERSLPEVEPSQRGMILYTSGTTSKPKGVVTTHLNIQSQIESLVQAWEWSMEDRIPLFLPLHHIHGIINVLSCALWCGATLEVFPRFQADAVLDRVQSNAYTLFMAVPTIYVKLIELLEKSDEPARDAYVAGFQRMRLMVSGSAALPSSIFDRWYALTGQRLVERYGMTEIGMALSNPYRGERRPGTVGMPLPGV
ncbi:MAG: AMP-binding protein, partial [Pirellula sp.]